MFHPLGRTRDGGEYSIFFGDGEIGYCGSEKIGIVARDLKSRKKEFLNRYTRRMWNLRVRYVIASKGQNDFTPPLSPHQWGRTLEFQFVRIPSRFWILMPIGECIQMQITAGVYPFFERESAFHPDK